MTIAQIRAAALSLRCNPYITREQRIRLVASLHANVNSDSVDYAAWQAKEYANGIGQSVHSY